MKVLKNVLFMLLAVGMFGSCIKEDLDDCLKYSMNTLSLSYKGDGTTEIFNEKIEKVVLYVFDQNEQLVTTKELTSEEVKQRNMTLPELEPGTYRVVCFGNMEKCQVNNLTCGDCDEMYCAAPEYFKGETISGNDPLYYASLQVTVTEEDQHQMLAFESSHYNVAVEVVGLYLEGGAHPRIEVCGVSPYTTFENVAGGEPTDYILGCEKNKGQFDALCNIMRHTNHEDVYVCLKDNEGNEVAKVNLAEFLTEHPEIDCSKQEVTIALRFEFKSVGVEVTVPDWAIEELKPEY